MEAVTFRNSHRHLLGNWLVRLPAVALMVSALNRYAAVLSWWSDILLAVFVLLTVPVLFAPLWAARFRTLTVDGDALVLRRGWFAPETRATARAQVTSVQVDEPLSQRLSGVRSVTILTSDATRGALEMPALVPSDVAALERMLAVVPRQSGTADSGVAEEAATPPGDCNTVGSSLDDVRAAEGANVLYRASVRDILATSVSGGYVLVMAGAVVGAAQEVGGWLDGAAVVTSWAGPLTVFLSIGALLVGVMALVAARFKDFRIERTATGQTRIAYGVVERSRHDISPGQVVAVTLVRTPADLLFGTSRLILSTAWLSAGDRRRLVFPSMPPAVAARVVGGVVGRHLPELFVERSRWWAAVPVAALTGAAAVALIVSVTGSRVIAGVAGAGLVLGLALMRYMCSVVSVTCSHDVICHRVSLSHKATGYLPGTVSMMVERRLPGVPIRNVTVLGWAHRRFVHRVPVRSASVPADVRRALRDSVQPLGDDPSAPTGPALEEMRAPLR